MKLLLTSFISVLIMGSALCQYTWTPMDPPNKESFFVFHCTDTHFFGKDLRNNIYVSTDELESWTQIASQVSLTTLFTSNAIGTVVQEDKMGNFYFFNRNTIYKYTPSDNTFIDYPKNLEIRSINNIKILANDNLLVTSSSEIELLDKLGNSINYRDYDIYPIKHVSVSDSSIYVHYGLNFNEAIDILDYDFIPVENFSFELHEDIRYSGFLVSRDKLIFSGGIYLDLDSKDWGSFNLSNNYSFNDHLLISGDTIVYTGREYAFSTDGGMTFVEGDWDGLVTSATARYYAGLHKGQIFKSNTFCFYGGDEAVFMDLADESISLRNLEYGLPFAHSVKAGAAENVLIYECDNDEDVLIKSDAITDWRELDEIDFSAGQFVRKPYDIEDWHFLPNGDILVNYGDIYRSTDNGRTWVLDNNLPFFFSNNLVIKGDNIYYLHDNIIYHSLYDGREWTELYNVQDVLFSFFNGGLSIDGYFYNARSILNGNNWQNYIIRHNLTTGKIDSFLQEENLGQRIITSNYNNDIHFLSGFFENGESKSFYNRSSDNGDSFVQINITELVGRSSLTWDVSLQLDRADNLILRVEEKIYVSIDQGESWINVTPTNPEIYQIGDVAVGLDNQMYIATIGAGVIKADFIFEGSDRQSIKIITFLDNNENCIRDNDEETMPGIRLSIDDIYTTVSDINGEITYNVTKGNHYLTPYIDDDLYASCESTYDFNVTEDSMTTIAVPIKIINHCAKIESSLATPFLRRCFENYYRGRIRNNGTERTDNLTVSVELDPFFEFESVDLDIISFDNHVLVLDAGELEPNEALDFNIFFTVSCDAELGQEHCVVLNVNADNLCDQNPLRQAPEECQENIGAYDPNDKTIFINGDKSAENYDFNDKIEYLIRCQNTGSDTAFNIVILDTISNKFKLESIRPLVASHDYKWFLEKDVLHVEFNDIQLVDSTTNEALSHAFVKFEIEIAEDLNYGDVLTNQAAIYFDFNEPIFTNTTMTEISTGTSVGDDDYSDLDILIYPNPTKGIFTINLKSEKSSLDNLRLYNITGQLVLEQNMSQSINQYDIDVSHLNSEVYTIHITGTDGKSWRSKLAKIQ